MKNIISNQQQITILSLLLPLAFCSSFASAKTSGSANANMVVYESQSVSGQAQACQLPDLYSDENYVDVGASFKVQAKTKSQMSRLQSQQLLITAQFEAGHDFVNKVKTLSQAIQFLTEASESEEVYIFTQKANGILYDIVLFYPGGNPVGLIFQKGTAQILATIEDSTVECYDPSADR